MTTDIIKIILVDDHSIFLTGLRLMINECSRFKVIGEASNGQEFLDLLQEMKPDVVFVAAGGTPTMPDIPGINRSNVISGGELHRRLKFFLRFFGPDTLRWLSRFYMPM